MYPCFISYCHGQHNLTKRFIEQLVQALNDETSQYMDEDVYVDTTRLKPGFSYNEALAQAICKSICMIVVYNPKYETHDYCLREFEGMKLVEQRRKDLLSAWPQERGMIIPIILRGDLDKLPEEIRAYRHYCDFTGFTTANTDIRKNKKFLSAIKEIGEVIGDNLSKFKESKIDLCSCCDSFSLPLIKDVPPWRNPPKPPWGEFPSREE